MKNKKIIFTNLLTCLLLSSCSLNFDKNGGDVVASLTQLPTPNITEVVNNYVYWDEVPNASSYTIKINSYQESAGNQLKYSIPSIIDSRIDYNIPTELHIYVKANGNQIMYSDSDWSHEYVFTYTKVKENNQNSKVTFNETHLQKGLGKTVDLINGAYNEVLLGGASIFDEQKLSELYVSTNRIRKGHQVTYTGDTIEKYIDDYTSKVSAKFSLSKIKPGRKKLVSQKSLGLDLGYDNEYSIRSESETSYYFYTYENSWEDEEIYFDTYKNSDIIKNALSTQFINDAKNLQSNSSEANIQSFIDKYGTHLITDAIFGAKLSVNYSLIGAKSSVSERSKNNVEVDLGISILYWEASTDIDINIDSSKYKSSNDVVSNLNVDFMGGKNVGFVFDKNDLNGFSSSYKTWAESTNDSNNNVLIDVRDKSLYCIWDLLDNEEFSSLKSTLDDYLDKNASESYEEYSSKINKFIKTGESINLNLENCDNGSIKVASVNGKEVEPNYQYKNGDVVKIEATPDSGYKFSNWFVDKSNDLDIDLNSETIEFTLIGNITIGAFFYLNSEMKDYSFGASIVTNTTVQGNATFQLTGVPVIYNGIEYIYGNAYYEGKLGGIYYRNVSVLDLNIEGTTALFGGLVSWSGTQGNSNESGSAAWDSTYTHDNYKVSYLPRNADNDFAGDKNVKITINGICIKVGNPEKDISSYPQLVKTSFSTNIYTENTNQGRVKFDVYGFNVSYNNSGYVYGCAYYNGKPGGTYFRDVEQIKFVNSSVEILNGGVMLHRETKGNFNESGVYSCSSLKVNSNECVFMPENGDNDFAGDKNVTITMTNICIKVSDTLSQNTNYLNLIEKSFNAVIYVENKYEDYVMFSALGLDLRYKNKNVLLGYAGYQGKIAGDLYGDCDRIILKFDDAIAIHGGFMHYNGNNNDWARQGTLASYSNSITDTLTYFADECSDDFPGKNADVVKIYINGMCFSY